LNFSDDEEESKDDEEDANNSSLDSMERAEINLKLQNIRKIIEMMGKKS